MSLADMVSPVLRRLDPEVWIITAADGARRGGLVATTLMSVSIVPELPRVALTIARHHATWELIERSGSFAAHLVSDDQDEWIWRFGTQSGRDVDKLAGLAWRPGTTGSPLLDGAVAWLECRIEERMPTGDRILYLAEVVAGALERDAPPLTMQRLLHRAPDDRRRQLQSQLAADARLDAAAIQAWRADRSARR